MNSNNYSAPPRAKSNVGLIVGIVVVVLFLCCGLIGFGGFFGFKSLMGNTSTLFACGNTMGDLRNAVVAYAKKHGGKLPAAKTWEDDVKPFIQHSPLPPPFQNAPAGQEDQVCDAKAPSSIYYNTELAGKPMSSIDPTDEKILLYEGPGNGKNLSGKFEVLPFETSPMLFNSHRGWLQQPLNGPAFFLNKNGSRAPVVVTQTGASVKVGN